MSKQYRLKRTYRTFDVCYPKGLILDAETWNKAFPELRRGFGDNWFEEVIEDTPEDKECEHRFIQGKGNCIWCCKALEELVTEDKQEEIKLIKLIEAASPAMEDYKDLNFKRVSMKLNEVIDRLNKLIKKKG